MDSVREYMKRYILFMILVMAGNVVEAMEPYNELRWAVGHYPRSKEALELLQNGADPNKADSCGFVPLSNANSKEQIELMLSYGADPRKMKQSGLYNVIHHYFCSLSKPSNVLDEQWHNEALEAMDLLLKHGESIHKRRDGKKGSHLLDDVLFAGGLCNNGRREVLSFLIARGSDPNKRICRGYGKVRREYTMYFTAQLNKFWDLEKFMRKERGWYLIRPLLLMTHFSKKTDEKGTEIWDYKQPSECAMRGLPKELVRAITDYLVHWKHDK